MADLQAHQFPCASCGARLHYAPGTAHLRCDNCGLEQDIERSDGAIVEYPLAEGLAAARRGRAADLDADGDHGLVRCEGCGASFVLEGQASRCPYCASPVVTVDDDRDQLVPESVLPFSIDRKSAQETFKKWVRSRWFAPNDFARRARSEGMDGVYLPYWTYDAAADSRYTGQRGEWYYVTETYRDNEGNTQTRQVRKTRWYPAAGRVHDSFDDVLLCASESLPASLVDGLEPWDLGALAPFQGDFLSGFSAERYAIEVGAGWPLARDRKMVPVVRQHVQRDIGGDEQRILSLKSDWSAIHFKLTLLPLWIASFRYGETVYRFAVNARTGQANGERPWSKAKIAAAIVAGLVLLGVLYALFREQG